MWLNNRLKEKTMIAKNSFDFKLIRFIRKVISLQWNLGKGVYVKKNIESDFYVLRKNLNSSTKRSAIII